MNQTTTNDKYSLAERLKRVKKTRWIRFSIVALLYIGWTIWLNNYYVLFGLLLDLFMRLGAVGRQAERQGQGSGQQGTREGEEHGPILVFCWRVPHHPTPLN